MTVGEVLQELKTQQVSARVLVERCLAAAQDPRGEGARVYTELFNEAALRTAERADERLRNGEGVRALEGVPISIKDLFDLEGSVTRGASRTREKVPTAATDAPAVARLRAAGAIILGKTNMTEFAYSGLGLNPHFGTPLNPFDRPAKRIPGGSSSGAAVSVSDRMAAAALGSDTGGSIRIPAALCGLVGWKPTAARVSRAGVLPLSPSLDSVGPIAADVASCALLDAALTGATPTGSQREGLSGARLAVPKHLLADDTDATVATAFSRALSQLGKAGATIIELPLREIGDVPTVGAGAVIVGAEAYAWHRVNLELHGSLYDPRVRSRLERGASYTAWGYLDALRCRAASIEAATRALQGFDAWLMPTVPLIAPRVAELNDDAKYLEVNKLMLRNPSIVNFLDGCAISLPCHRLGEPPVGLTVAGIGNADLQILDLARQVERVLNEELSR